MRESRVYRVLLTQTELVRALKQAYPDSLAVQSIPAAAKEGVIMKVESPLTLTFIWEREIKGS
jgi:hypothetical protein